ncbi:ABC transporter substrate-binding protein [Candidatus Halobonum tyrrellensis]|uniref:Spermidine/putrescine-binding periplasmic protein-like protein n=1 Tax=Candidatus Halobonum tyrrellensis G22 TaxID=1324957 RepID=V4HMS6_9EURY|nr:extracellular solute-binding protein [Candidatus Halobonum tyrrellensis]ESP89234.1 spermidine/putrescine-binding periplasmic protein-like protein [Candidatus Halobonum tyrrellensis G22]
MRERSDPPALNRRRFLEGAAAAGITASAAGCLGGGGGGDDRVPMDVAEWPPEDIGSQLNMWNWYDSWVEWASGAFEEEFDVSVSNTGYSSPDQWYSQLEADNSEIDNIAATTNWVERSIENDFLHELPVDVMPAWENITDRVKQASSYQQDGSVYAVPEALVLYPLTYNDEYFDSAPTSWGVLWDDEHEGELCMWDNATVSCQIAAMYTGQDPIDPDDFDEIREVLIQQKPLLRTYWGDYQQGMSLFVNEDVVAGPLTMGRTYTARFGEGAPVHYTAPEEGAMYTSDLFVIPRGAPNPMASLQFTNWASQPENASRLFETMGYLPAVDITDQLSEEDAEFVDWPDEWNLVFSATLSDEVRSQYDEIWTAVKAA